MHSKSAVRITDGGVEQNGESAEWLVGAAAKSITPDETEPHHLAGFSARDGPMEGVHDDIHVKAATFEDRTGRRLAVVTVDQLFVPEEQRLKLESECEERWDVEPDGLIVKPTHTHYAPSYRTRPDDVDEDTPQEEKLAASHRKRVETAVLATIERAFEDAEPARLTHCHSRCAIATSRRRPDEEKFRFEPYSDAPVHHHVPVLAAEVDSGFKALLFGYACHPTSVNAFNQVSGDWPGHAVRYLEEAHPDATAMFLIGCAGDQKAYPQGSTELARQHGRTMANAVEAALGTIRTPVRGPLRMASQDVVLDIEEQKEDDRGNPVGADVVQRAYPMRAIGFGTDLTMLSLSGEVVADYANVLEEELDGPLWITAYTDKPGYIPTRRILFEGGYEARSSPTDGRYAVSTEERVVRTACALAERVGCAKR